MKIYIYEEIARFNTCILFYEDIPEGLKVYNFSTGEVLIIKREQEFPKEFAISLPRNILPELAGELVKHLDKQGIRSDTEQKLEGKLEATQEHLKDLRQLLKLK